MVDEFRKMMREESRRRQEVQAERRIVEEKEMYDICFKISHVIKLNFEMPTKT